MTETSTILVIPSDIWEYIDSDKLLKAQALLQSSCLPQEIGREMREVFNDPLYHVITPDGFEEQGALEKMLKALKDGQCRPYTNPSYFSEDWDGILIYSRNSGGICFTGLCFKPRGS